MADTANRSRGSGRRVRGAFVPEARCGYRNPTLSSILATQMPCRTPSRSEALRSATDALRRLLARRSAGAVLKPSGGNCVVLPLLLYRLKYTVPCDNMQGDSTNFMLYKNGIFWPAARGSPTISARRQGKLPYFLLQLANCYTIMNLLILENLSIFVDRPDINEVHLCCLL